MITDLSVQPQPHPDGGCMRYWIHWWMDGIEWGDWVDVAPADTDPGIFMPAVLQRVMSWDAK